MLLFNNKAVSLFEISLVLFIVGLFLMGVLPMSQGFLTQARQKASEQNILTIARSAKIFYAQYGFWPKNMEELAHFLKLKEIPGSIEFSQTGNALIVKEGATHKAIYPDYGRLARIAYDKTMER